MKCGVEIKIGAIGYIAVRTCSSRKPHSTVTARYCSAIDEAAETEGKRSRDAVRQMQSVFIHVARLFHNISIVSIMSLAQLLDTTENDLSLSKQLAAVYREYPSRHQFFTG